MSKILPLLADITGGKSYGSFQYCADDELTIPTLEYEKPQKYEIYKDRFGETAPEKRTKSISSLAKSLISEQPLFRFFLDGSRRTYKVDDLEINKRIFPIMAGQIGVACCERRASDQFAAKEVEKSLVLSLPSEANPDALHPELGFNNLRKKINNLDRIDSTGISFSKVLSYSSRTIKDSLDIGSKYENLGIATIQDEMIDNEKRIVASLTAKSALNENGFLMKDGSLQYKPMKTGDYKELSKIKNNYQWVVGVSKLFNPELSRDRRNKSNASAIANLPLFHRTPAYMYQTDMVGNINFSIWYLRIRDKKYTEGPFAGVLKIEKILITDRENESGLDSELIDLISANIVNERNPVCYGQDSRWANHLYPVYLTERYLKSLYISDSHFLNLF